MLFSDPKNRNAGESVFKKSRHFQIKFPFLLLSFLSCMYPNRRRTSLQKRDCTTICVMQSLSVSAKSVLLYCLEGRQQPNALQYRTDQNGRHNHRGDILDKHLKELFPPELCAKLHLVRDSFWLDDISNEDTRQQRHNRHQNGIADKVKNIQDCLSIPLDMAPHPKPKGRWQGQKNNKQKI